MPLYVIRPPDPPVGFDWSYAIPGQYVEEIVSVSATLTTLPAGATVAADVSGNGFDGTYHGPNNAGWFQPGIVAGDLAILTGQLLTGPRTWLSAPVAVLQWAAPWSFAMWLEIPLAVAGLNVTLCRTTAHLADNLIHIWMENPLNGSLRVDAPGAPWRTAAGVIPTNGTACFIALTWDGTTLIPYIDGVPVAWASTPPAPFTAGIQGTPFFWSALGATADTEILADELALWSGAISAGDVASMFAARSVSFSAYSAAVLAASPAIYYHLDDGVEGTSRTPTCAITDGFYTVGEFPSGFPAGHGSAAYSYTWTAKQTANSQSANGLVTSISLPALLLPAGYTIGTVTPGLGGLDQWSNIAIWWDSSYMDSINHPYEYPPGQHLVYVSDPNAPVN